MAFPENLQFLRTRAGTTQEQLAEELGVSRQSVSKWESGASFPEMDTLLRICNMYDTGLDTLLRGDVEKSLVTDTAQYDKTMNRFSRRIAFSVGAIIAAVGIMLFITAAGLSEMLAGAFLLLVITVSAVVLVASGIQDDHFRKKYPSSQTSIPRKKRTLFSRNSSGTSRAAWARSCSAWSCWSCFSAFSRSGSPMSPWPAAYFC